MYQNLLTSAIKYDIIIVANITNVIIDAEF